MKTRLLNLLFSLVILSVCALVERAHAQDEAIRVECSTASLGGTACLSQSANATTSSNVVAGIGNVNKVRLRNVENVPVVIRNSNNTDQMYLYADINNRGRPQDVTIDLRPLFTKAQAPQWMKESPNAGSGLVLVDSINSLSVDVSGYRGKGGRNLSQLCADRARTADGFFSNPNNSSSIREANDNLKAKVGADGLCDQTVMAAIMQTQPGNFCPAEHFYLPNRDFDRSKVTSATNSPQPRLNKSEGDILGSLSYMPTHPLYSTSSTSNEAPVRYRFLKKCVEDVIFKKCSFRRYFTNPQTGAQEITYQVSVSDIHHQTCEDSYQSMRDQEVTFKTCEFRNGTDVRTYTGVHESCEDRYNLLVSRSEVPAKMTVSQTASSVFVMPSDLTPIEIETRIRDVFAYFSEDSFTPPEQVATCPEPQQTFENYTQSHGYDEYDQFECTFGNCPGAVDTYSYDTYSPVNFSIEPGESGSFGGRFDIFAYDISATHFTFANGDNGSNGAVDVSLPKVTKFCAKVTDARVLNTSDEASKAPLVNFHSAEYTPMKFTLPATVPGTSFGPRTLNQAVGVFKKVDSSVRDFMLKEYVDPRFL